MYSGLFFFSILSLLKLILRYVNHINAEIVKKSLFHLHILYLHIFWLLNLHIFFTLLIKILIKLSNIKKAKNLSIQVISKIQWKSAGATIVISDLNRKALVGFLAWTQVYNFCLISKLDVPPTNLCTIISS